MEKVFIIIEHNIDSAGNELVVPYGAYATHELALKDLRKAYDDRLSEAIIEGDGVKEAAIGTDWAKLIDSEDNQSSFSIEVTEFVK